MCILCFFSETHTATHRRTQTHTDTRGHTHTDTQGQTYRDPRRHTRTLGEIETKRNTRTCRSYISDKRHTLTRNENFQLLPKTTKSQTQHQKLCGRSRFRLDRTRVRQELKSFCSRHPATRRIKHHFGSKIVHLPLDTPADSKTPHSSFPREIRNFHSSHVRHRRTLRRLDMLGLQKNQISKHRDVFFIGKYKTTSMFFFFIRTC